MDRQAVKVEQYPTRRGMVVALTVGRSRAALDIDEAEDVLAELEDMIAAAKAEREVAHA